MITSLSGSFITGQRHFQEKNPSNDAPTKYLVETFLWNSLFFFFLLYCVFSNLQFLDHSLKEENSFLQKIGRLDK